ncbi:DUF6906 family protein [Evansella tamaricis]|uniref:DUF6906 domain-containing protein n=1 Tax=Evansella tamaricis TaxID=2069301 RepID=A0ABS6JBS4_9BACI|nr:hypothetical protein [Evansella tamaricis]MBU9711100.1 hypothetical protein [Evansella tamaricis]
MKRVTRKYLSALMWTGLNHRNWLVKQERGDQLVIKHKEVGVEKTIPL